MKGLVTRNKHKIYERSITSGVEVMAKVKVFVHAIDADADGRAMTLVPWTYMSRLAKNYIITECECLHKRSDLIGRYWVMTPENATFTHV